MQVYLLQLLAGVVIGCYLGRDCLKQIINDIKVDKNR